MSTSPSTSSLRSPEYEQIIEKSAKVKQWVKNRMKEVSPIFHLRFVISLKLRSRPAQYLPVSACFCRNSPRPIPGASLPFPPLPLVLFPLRLA
ncbi:hypothetical protein WR25_09975 [Diploscapter pachys]|uniref:Uncharacterized protein n=1 Tax=Diploscapter pachys TaxID=2018661 RepID=A0A2A2KR31_9BILA|nr:hypothetical protein WR25_09975 [Diploscapter pachys]